MDGRVYRVVRSSRMVSPDRVRFALRAQSLKPDSQCPDLELAREVDAEAIRDKIANHHAIPTPESTFEALWEQLRVDLDSHGRP
ncbi:MAG: hypothetical protein JO057_14930 [Chloroflexi bacterium]|nr:hypothetical protein [Chloroflexota bacterium]